MKLHELRDINEAHAILISILDARKNCTWTPPKEGEKKGPFDIDWTTDLTYNGKEMKISRSLMAKFFYEAEEYYRNKLANMGIEDVANSKRDK